MVNLIDADIEVIRGHRATLCYVQSYDPIARESVLASGEAIRHPDDKHDDDLATALAMGRALSSLGRKLERRANGRIKCNDDNARKSGETGTYTVKLKWQFEDDSQAACQATTNKGEQCKFSARKGTWYCGHHS